MAPVINVISTAPQMGVGGGAKVYLNLAKGLRRIGHPFVVNGPLDSTSRLWIHNDVFAIEPAMRQQNVECLLGPNLFVMPRDMPPFDLRGAQYVLPSEWNARMWRGSGFAHCPVVAWPVGIDTDDFSSPGARRSDRVLLYHKRRDPRELEDIRQALTNARLNVIEVHYGRYTESEYKAALADVGFVVWHGRHESQGIALEEALAADRPVLVVDVATVLDAYGDGYRFEPRDGQFPATAAPYFDETCGIKVSHVRELPAALEIMRETLDAYRPRDFVLRHLSLEGQARAFVALWKGTHDHVLRPHRAGDWQPSLWHTVSFRVRRRAHLMTRRSRGA